MGASLSENTWVNLWSVVLECTMFIASCIITTVVPIPWTTTLCWTVTRFLAVSPAWRIVRNITTPITRQAFFIWIEATFWRFKFTGARSTTWKLLTATLDYLCCILTNFRLVYRYLNWRELKILPSQLNVHAQVNLVVCRQARTGNQNSTNCLLIHFCVVWFFVFFFWCVFLAWNTAWILQTLLLQSI